MFYGPENIFTFRYTDAAADIDFTVEGPHLNDPSLPLWRVSPIVQISPDQVANLETLDLTKLRNPPSAVLNAAGPDLEALAAPFGACTDHQLIAAVGSQNGQLAWTVNLGCGRFIGTTSPPIFTCDMPDADLTQRSCRQGGGQPWTPPVGSTYATPDPRATTPVCPH